MDLYYRKYGNGPPLVIVHGLYGSSDNWVTIGKALAGQFTVYLIDQRNHGNSPHSREHNYDLMKQDLLSFLIGHNLNRTILAGHSMGGKTVMAFAADYPDRVAALIVMDIGPKNYTHLARGDSRTIDHEQIVNALLNIDLEKITMREDAGELLAGTIPSSGIRSFLLKNLERNKDGSYAWKLNLEAIRDNLPVIMGGLEAEDLRNHRGISGFPVLFVRGEKSPYIPDEDIPVIKKMFPTADFVTIPGAGHWLHVEQPELLVKTLNYFLS